MAGLWERKKKKAPRQKKALADRGGGTDLSALFEKEKKGRRGERGEREAIAFRLFMRFWGERNSGDYMSRGGKKP